MPNDKLARLRAALIEGEQSGRPTTFDFDACIARKRQASEANASSHASPAPVAPRSKADNPDR